MPSIINASSSGSGGLVQTADASGVLQLQSNGTTALNISGTNVGLGTTSPAAVAGQSLQLGNQSGVFQLNVNGDLYTAHNMYYDGTNWRYLATGEASMLDFGGGRINFFRAASGTAGAVATLIPTLTVDNTDTTSVILNRGTLTFPATQNPSTNPNTLDDYEEGTFTPTLNRSDSSPTVTYAVRQGTYTKIGNMVTVSIACQSTAVSPAGSGNTSITGLPFVNGGTTYTGAGAIAYNDAGVATLSGSWISSTTVFFRSGTRSSGNDASGWGVGYMFMTITYLV
jgi:hypothetical protein